MCILMPLEIGRHWTEITMYDTVFTKDGIKGTGKILWTMRKVDSLRPTITKEGDE